jgi:hypothetical protein
MTKHDAGGGSAPPALIDARIAALDDWRGAMLAKVRAIILDADPQIEETVKWRKPTNPHGVPVWEYEGIICTGEVYKNYVKLTFAYGGALDDPAGLFNASLTGNTRRAIDFHEGDSIDKRALKALIRAAVARNTAHKAVKKSPISSKAEQPKLLSGGNPQIPLGYGDEPVQAYIATMPGWKQEMGGRIDALIVRAVPEVRKAVKWNTPFYGVEENHWFLAYHCFAKYIKVTFFRGASMDPIPPVASKQPEVRYFHIHEDEELDETQFTAWVEQASQLPGERL